MNLNEMKLELAIKNKRGVSFILASIILWTGVYLIWKQPMENVEMKNLLTFCVTTPLLPAAFLISRLIKAEFSVKDNPLNNLGLLFSLNQMLYILIPMWAYAAHPDKMVMLLAMIYGAHLLPFSWLYNSRAYFGMSIFVPIFILIFGLTVAVDRLYLIPLAMIGINLIFSVWLIVEHRAASNSKDLSASLV